MKSNSRSTYNGYQISLKNISQEVADILQAYTKKYGYPPQILETSLKDIPLPDGMNLVVRWQQIPKNIILIGEVADGRDE